MSKLRTLLPSSFFNPTSLVGASVACVSFGLIIFLFALELFAGHQKPYMGIIAFVILPAFLLMGIAIVLVGMRNERKRRLKTGIAQAPFPLIDLNDPKQRKRFTFAASIVIVLLLSSAFGSYQVYEFTESVQFCGEVCHSVMKPEYTAYLHSPHARVTCTECHVGSGADWYVKSKLSGAYQVYSVLFEKYSRPIPTPVHNLRPAQGTCEQCHWPKHFYSDKLVTKTYFMPDEQNTPWAISLLMKIGGGSSETGPTSGIHWHMNIANEVTYTAIDLQRQIIPVVRAKHPDGTVEEYITTDPFDESLLNKGETRRMDCIDCHNRPTHIYHSPEFSINELMSLGWISPSLPSIRAIASAALIRPYTNENVALDSIRHYIHNEYRLRYPILASSRKSDIDTAITHLQRIYSRNFFPEMRVSWKEYPNNIGHFSDSGCFRCHDGKHVSKSGKVLSKDCNTCHIIVSQGSPDKLTTVSTNGLPFVHPVDIGTSWNEMNCNDCHTGQ